MLFFLSAMERTQRAARCLIIAFLYMTSLTVAGGDIRLAGSRFNCIGRVEFYNGTQGRVCSNNWDIKDAKVVCNQLKCGDAVVAGPARFGGGTGTFFLIDVDCKGNEKQLTKCGHNTSPSCSGKDAEVVCSKGIPKPIISLFPKSEVTWGDNTTITCSISQVHPLVQGHFILKNSDQKERGERGTNDANFSFFEVTFEDEGQYQCRYESKQGFVFLSSSVMLHVTVRLEPPNISASSPNGGQQWAFDQIQVTKGHSFVINCFNSARSPEGLFLLHSSGSNMNTTQTSENHRASFRFPAADFEHQGNYSCVYVVTGPSRNFTSPLSSVISVTVQRPLLPVVLPVVVVSLLLLVVIGLYWFRRRQRVFQPTTPTQTQMTARNKYKDSDSDEEADYVNISPGRETDQVFEGSKDSDDEPDYVNVSETLGVNTYRGDNRIYQNL